MNAYELANEWDEYCGNTLEWNGKSSKKLSNMLRQQADRIAELEKELKDMATIGYMYGFEKGKDLKKTNAEPAYWVLKTGHGTKFEEVKPYCEIDLWKPLYTTPQTKPLSDEEIREIWGNESLYVDEGYGAIKFARAIQERILGK